VQLRPGEVVRVAEDPGVDVEGRVHLVGREQRACRVLVGSAVVELDRHDRLPLRARRRR
jgi:hypothetical protein